MQNEDKPLYHIVNLTYGPPQRLVYQRLFYIHEKIQIAISSLSNLNQSDPRLYNVHGAFAHFERGFAAANFYKNCRSVIVEHWNDEILNTIRYFGPSLPNDAIFPYIPKKDRMTFQMALHELMSIAYNYRDEHFAFSIIHRLARDLHWTISDYDYSGMHQYRDRISSFTLAYQASESTFKRYPKAVAAISLVLSIGWFYFQEAPDFLERLRWHEENTVLDLIKDGLKELSNGVGRLPPPEIKDE